MYKSLADAIRDAEYKSPTIPWSIAPRMTASARPSTPRMSSTVRP